MQFSLLAATVSHFGPIRLLSIIPFYVHCSQRRVLDDHRARSQHGWGWKGLLEVIWSNPPVQQGHPELAAQDHDHTVCEGVVQSPAVWMSHSMRDCIIWMIPDGLPKLYWVCDTLKSFRLKHLDSGKPWVGVEDFSIPKLMLASILSSSLPLCPTFLLGCHQQMPQGCSRNCLTCACVFQVWLCYSCLPHACPRACGFLSAWTGIAAPLWHSAR